MSFFKTAINLKYHGLHMLPENIKPFFQAEGYIDLMLEIDNSEQRKAELTIQMLNCMALSPTEGYESVDDCYYDGDGTAAFMLHFNRITNPIGMFTLELSDPLFQSVLDAISENLKSRMYKAAIISRRIERLSVKAQVRYRRKAGKAYEQVMDAAEVSAEVIAQAEQAYNDSIKPNETRLFNRLRSVSNVAMPNAENGYTIWLAEFLHNNVTQ